MKKNSMFSKGLSVFLAVLMVFSASIVGIAPLADKANAEVSKDVAQGAPVFSLKWNVPESIYLTPGAATFQYFLTNTLTSAGADAVKTASTSGAVTVDAPLAKAMSLSYVVESGKTPAGGTASTSGISFDIANNVSGTTSINNVLTGKKMNGYSNAIAGNEYFIKWTLTFEIEVEGVTKTFTNNAYTTVYVPFLGQAGASLHSKYQPFASWTPPQNWAYTFITGGHSVTGGNYTSNFLSNDLAGLEANKSLYKDDCGSATFIAPLVQFTGGNPGKDNDNTDYPFSAGATIPWNSSFVHKYAITEQANGGVYYESNDDNAKNGWDISGRSDLGQLDITVDTSRFSHFEDIPNLKVGMAQFRWDYDGANNALRWVKVLAPGTTPSYSDKDLNSASLNNGIGEAKDFSCADANDNKSRAIGLFSLQNVGDSTVSNGIYKVLFDYRNSYTDGIGQQRNGVVAAVNLNVKETAKDDLRNSVFNAYVSGYGCMTSSSDAVKAYFNAVTAGSKVLADQFATAAEVTAAKNAINSAFTSDVQSTIERYTKFSAVEYDSVGFNVPETIYLVPSKNASSNYEYVLDQNMTYPAEIDSDTNTPTGKHNVTITPNTGYKNISDGGKIQFAYAAVAANTVELHCNDSSVEFEPLTFDSNTGIYSTAVTGGSHAYSSGYITWYVTYTDTVDGMEKSVTGQTYIYAPSLKSVAATSTAQSAEGSSNRYVGMTSVIYGIHDVVSSYGRYILGVEGTYGSGKADGSGTFTATPIIDDPLALIFNTDTDDGHKPDFFSADSENNAASTSGMGYYYRTDAKEARPGVLIGGRGKLYFDPARADTVSDLPNFGFYSINHGFNQTGDLKDNSGNAWASVWVAKTATAYSTDSTAVDSELYASVTADRFFNSSPKLYTPKNNEGSDFVLYKDAPLTFINASSNIVNRYSSRNAQCFDAVTCDFVPVNKATLRASIIAAQAKFAEYGIYFDGTNYGSLYYNVNETNFKAFINAYKAAVAAAAKLDGTLGSEAATLNTAITNVENAIVAANADGASAEAKAILKPAKAKLYNVSYDASVDKRLRTISAFESVKTNEKYNVDFNAKDTVYYTTEDYTGYTFLGFVKSTTDLASVTINGSVMAGAPSYISADDYKQQSVSGNSFGTAAAVGYPSTVPTFTADNEFNYTNTVDPAIYMVGLYQPNHYTVSYDLNEGTGTTPAGISAVYDVAYTSAASTGISRRGYTFAGWNTAADGTGTAIAENASFKNLTATDNGTVTLYAQWEEDETQIAHYTVKFLVKNAGDAAYTQYGDVIEGTGIIGDTVTYNASNATITGFALESGAGTYTLSDGLVIELKYIRNTYQAKFYGADNTTVILTLDVPVGQTYAFNGTNPAKSGYVNEDLVTKTGYTYYNKGHYSFIGWSTTANDDEIIEQFPVMTTEGASYYPVFEVVNHNFSAPVATGASCTNGAYDTYSCSCGYSYTTAQGQPDPHDYNYSTFLDPQQAPTCTEGGYHTVKCKNCTATKLVTDDPTGHKLNTILQVDATCTTAGSKAYYECSVCHAKFSDSNAVNAITAPETIPATGHDYQIVKYTWSADGKTCTADLACSKNPTDHKITARVCTVTDDSTTPADCENAGTKTYKASVSVDVANDQNKEARTFTDTKTVPDPDAPATGHAWGDPTFIWNADHSTCKAVFVCGNNSAHTKERDCTVKSETTDPTGGNDGYTEYVAEVTEDGETYTSETEKVIDENSALGYKVTVKFLFADDSKAAEPVTKTYDRDAISYSIPAASVPGYTPTPSVVSGSFAKTDITKEITVRYTANTDTAYVVNHYKQTADGSEYTLAETDNLSGTTGANTTAAAKTYTGFTAKTFTQKPISGDGSTVIDIYYDRDVYTVTWNVGTGATVTGQTASVLYGNDIDFTVAYGTGYDQVILPVTVTGGTLAGTYKVTNITGSVVVNVPTQINTYTVAVTGDAGVTVSDNATVNYGGSYTLTVTPKDNYKQTPPTAKVNGVDLALTKNGDVYTATIENIAEHKTIAVTSAIDSYTLTITYKYADDSEAAATVTKSVNYGADYVETCPVIAKFVPVVIIGSENVVTSEVKGTMGTSDVTVNIVYLADENENGKPDVDDSKFTVTFDYGRYGTAVDGQIYAVNVIPDTAYDTITLPTVNAKDGFTFVEWLDDGIANITGDITIYASYTTKDENDNDITVDNDTYLIKFVNYDGTLLKAIAADAGDTVTAPADPTRGGFTFAGWTPDFVAAVTGDATYTATFKTAKTEGGTEEVIGADEYVVSFYTFDGKLIEAQFVTAGSTASAPAVPARDGFTANGWTPAFNAAAAVNADASYTASYKTKLTESGEEEVIEAGKYVIKFFTFDGKLLVSFVKGEGETFTAPEVPDRANTTSKAWAPTVKTTVDGDAVYTASYKTKLDPADTDETDVPANSYVISFYTYDGQLIERKLVAAGEDVIAPDAPARGDFTFAGWTPAFADKANADASYKATYKTKLNPADTTETLIPDGQFVVSFVNYDGKLVEAKLVAAGETTTAPATVPTRANCTFKAWAPAFSETAPVTEDKTYTATYTTKDENGSDVDVNEDQFVVKFFNYDDTLLKTFVVNAGEKVTAPTATRGDFTFAGWTPAFDANAAVNADASYKATFKTALVPGGTEQIIPDGFVAVRFFTYKDELIKAEFVPVGSTVPSAPTAPVRAECTFAGWTPTYKNTDTVSVDTAYKATYKTALVPGGTEQTIPEDMFVVRFVDANDVLISAVFVAKNGTAAAPAMDGTADYFDNAGHYGFDKWDKEFTNITADTTVKGQYGFTAHTLADKDVVAASCLVNGSKTEYCTGCGYEKKNVVIPAPGHTVVKDPAVAPTCTETGLTEGSHCSVCDLVIVERKPVAATGHSFGAWTIVKYATDTEDGEMKRVCSVCLYEETKPYSKSDEYLVIGGSNILPIGQVVEIPVTRMPVNAAETVIWTTSDPSIAFPDEDGNIVVLGMGQVTLTATTADGLTASKTFVVNDSGNTRVIKFNNIDKMHYILAGYYCVYASSNIRWSQDYALKFRVHLYQTFNFPTVIVRANGVELKENADGSYTIPAGEGPMVITVEGAGVEQSTGEKVSFWQMLINFFNKIISFFRNLFK